MKGWHWVFVLLGALGTRRPRDWASEQTALWANAIWRVCGGPVKLTGAWAQLDGVSSGCNREKNLPL